MERSAKPPPQVRQPHQRQDGTSKEKYNHFLLYNSEIAVNQVKLLDYVFSKHAENELNKAGRSQIKKEWIERTLTDPDYTDKDPRTNANRAWKRIPEYGNRFLRVVYNLDKQPIVIVTVFFDRSFKQ